MSLLPVCCPAKSVGATLVVARPAPPAEIVPEGWLGFRGVVWTEEGADKGRAPTRGAPTGFEIKVRPVTNAWFGGTPHQPLSGVSVSERGRGDWKSPFLAGD